MFDLPMYGMLLRGEGVTVLDAEQNGSPLFCRRGTLFPWKESHRAASHGSMLTCGSTCRYDACVGMTILEYYTHIYIYIYIGSIYIYIYIYAI